MSTVACPECKEVVRVPLQVSEGDQLRCPWCRKEFAASEVLAQLPPLMEIVSSGADESPHPGWERLADLADSAAEADSEEGTASDDAFSFQATDVTYASAAAMHRSPRSTGRNTVIEFAKIAAGGVLAIPIALFILLWLGRDVLHIGPSIGTYVPWIVPAQYRAGEEYSETETGNRAVEDSGEAGRSVFRDGQVVAPPPVPDELEEDGARTDREGTEKSNAALPHASPHTSSMPPTATVDATPVSGVRDAPVITAASFDDSVKRAEAAWQAWRDAQQKDSAAASVEKKALLFRQLGAVAESAVFVESTSERVAPIADRAVKLLEQIAQQTDLLPWIGNQAQMRWAATGRPIRGVVMFGTAGRIRRQGGYFVTELALAAKEKTMVEVLSVADPGDTFSKGDRILVLGVIVDHPAELVIGYEGEAPRVLVGALPYRVSPPAR